MNWDTLAHVQQGKAFVASVSGTHVPQRNATPGKICRPERRSLRPAEAEGLATSDKRRRYRTGSRAAGGARQPGPMAFVQSVRSPRGTCG
jgi:hypothetical protein